MTVLEDKGFQLEPISLLTRSPHVVPYSDRDEQAQGDEPTSPHHTFPGGSSEKGCMQQQKQQVGEYVTRGSVKKNHDR